MKAICSQFSQQAAMLKTVRCGFLIKAYAMLSLLQYLQIRLFFSLFLFIQFIGKMQKVNLVKIIQLPSNKHRKYS